MRKIATVFLILIASSIAACSKPMVSSTINPDVKYLSRDYAAVPNDIYYAVRAVFRDLDYPVNEENLSSGVITSTWMPTTSDSHYMLLFDRKEYGVTNSYYQMEVQVVSEEGRTRVKAGTRLKGIVANQHSSGIEEKKLLDLVGNYLRKSPPDVTNLGLVNE